MLLSASSLTTHHITCGLVTPQAPSRQKKTLHGKPHPHPLHEAQRKSSSIFKFFRVGTGGGGLIFSYFRNPVSPCACPADKTRQDTKGQRSPSRPENKSRWKTTMLLKPILSSFGGNKNKKRTARSTPQNYNTVL
ncbi:unnamed protein product [Ectocarpus sp. 8 AP-2014]